MKRATVAVLLSGLIALLTLGLSGCGSGSSAPQAIGVRLAPSGTKSIDQAQTVAITAAVANDSKNAGVTWTVSGTNGSQGTLTNTSTTSATYNAPASVTSAFTATITAASVTDTTKLSTLTINVNPLPSITTTSLAAATAGTAYSATLVETGGSSPYTWSITSAPGDEKRARVRPAVASSTLPAGLSLNSSTGIISGTPTGGGSGSYTFTVTDAAGATATQAINFTVNPPPALTIATATLPAAVMGTAYPQTQLQATGGVQPYTWSVPPGTLPAGLTLSSAGVISGTPTGLVTGPIGFTVTVTDVETPTPAATPAGLSIAVSAPPLSVTTSSLPGGTMNNVYGSQTLQAKGGVGADTWKLASGSSLPSGLTLSPAGVIAGMPNGNFVGPTNFTVVVTDSETPTAQTATAGLSIAITVAPLTVSNSGSLPTGVANSVYPGVTLQATGGIQPFTNWTVVGGNTNLPPGLTLNPATGAISGTPTTAGTTSFTVTVTDSEATPKTATSATLSITVNPALSVTTTSLPAGVVGTAYAAGTTLQAAGGISPFSWSITTGSLPVGLSLNSSTGSITGKPTGPAVGTIIFTVTVTDSESPSKTATQSLSIVITAPQLTVTTTTASLPTGVIGNTYSTTLAASGGAGAYTWAVTGGNASLPPGLTLNTATGVISGTPTATGPTTFTVTVTDSETPTAQTASASLTISVNNSAPLGITTTTAQLPTGVTGTAYPPTTLQASGGVTPYTWSYTGSLPTGLNLSASGVITGTPTATGTFNFTVKVTDSTKPTANTKTASLSITVDTPITVTTTSQLPTGYVGLAYSQTLAASGGSGKGYTWAVSSGSALPGGLTLSAAGVLSGKPTTVGNPSFSVTVTDSASNTGTGTLSMTIKAGVSITSSTPLPTGYVGSAYSQTLTATGGSGTGYAWSVTSGSTLPGGLTLSAAGVLGGKPTTVGKPSFSITVTDSLSNTATAAFSMTISTGVSITTGSPLPTGYQGTAYPATTFAATGGTGTGYSWTWAAASGSSLPAGLNLSTGGLISGIPTAAGTFNIVVTVTDSALNTASSTFSLTVEATLTITTTSPLKTGTVNVAYSQQLAATGGTGAGTYTWSTNTAGTSSLAAVGLSLSPAGLVSGGSPSLGSASFTATVTDSASHTASVTFAVTIANLLTVTTATLPAATTGAGYSQTLSAAGGSGTGYTWSVSGTSNLATFNLSLSSAGVISGTPATTGTASFTAKVTDSASNTATQALTIQVYNALSLPTPNPSSLGSATVGQFYTGTITASGGSGNFTWTVTGLSDNLGSSPNGATLTISGTPNTPTVVSFNVSVRDNITLATAANTYTITVNNAPALSLPPAGPLANATINQNYSGAINASGGVGPNYTFTVNGATVPTSGTAVALGNGTLAVSNTGGNTLSIGGTPTSIGTVSFTVAVTDSASDNAGPNTYTISVINPGAAYTVSGTVGYGGSKSGWTYLELYSNNCSGCNNNLGTSISEATLTSGGAFTIHGVPPGTYTLQAFMDNLGYGAQNASNPTGSIQNVTVTNEGVSGLAVVLTDPPAVTLSTAPTWKSSIGSGAFSGGAFVSFQTIQNSNGIEMPASYTVEWSTSSSFSTVTGSKSFAATGGNNPWIVNGLTNGTTYYFRAQGVAGSSTSAWSATSSAITIDPPTGGYAVSGTVTFSETASGPLYVGFYDQNTSNVYADVVGSKASPPKSPASYSVNVPAGSNYFFFGILDQNNTGLISGPGQVSNTGGNNNTAPVVISGTTTGKNLILPSTNSAATVMTQNSEQINQNGTSSNYSVGFNVNGLLKLPVAVEIATESDAGVVIPADIAAGGFNGNGDQFSFWTGLNGAAPKVGDTYTLDVTYSDNTTQILTVTVSAVLDAFVTPISPVGTSASLTPNFSWTDPANASNYTYQFWLCCNSNNNGNNTIWQIPGNNSNSNGFSSSITSLTWGSDPTNPNNPPNVSSLNGSTNYNWQIQATDINGNSAQVQVSFETPATPLTLPTPGSVGTAVIGQGFNGAINASGGVGPNYTFTVNGSVVPTDGTEVSLGDGLYAYNTGGNTLSLTGTPTTATTVSFTVAVTDSGSDTIGPYTYSITVTPASALSIQTTTMPGGNEGWAYNTYIQANGGVQPYTWSITSGSSNLTAVGLTFTNNPQNNQSEAEISGTPSATGTASFTVQVTDNEGTMVSQPLSIAVTGCTNNSKLSGNYAMLIQGWSDASQGEVFLGLAASFVANGSGSITSGAGDYNDPTDGYAAVTIANTSTYCVAGNDQGLMTINTNQGSLPLAFALQSSGNGSIIAYQSNNGFQGSGVLLKQTTSAFSLSKITGPYALGLIGVDQGGNRFGLAGAFTANGTADLTSGQLDANDNGKVNGGNGIGSPMTFSSSDVSTVNTTTGRGTVGIDVTGVGTLNFAYYVVSATQLLLIQTDAISGPGGSLFTGQILQQSGTFSDASLNGVSVIEVQGLDTSNSPATPDAQAGFFTANSSNDSFSVAIDENDGGTMESDSGSGSYSVAANGRVTLTGAGNHPPELYMIAKNQAFVLGTDGIVSFGTLTPQQAITFSDSSFSGNYLGGSEQPVNSNVKASVLQVDAAGTGTLTGTQYQINNCGSGCTEPNISSIPSGLTYAPDPDGLNGKFDIDQAGTPQVYLYMISTTQAAILNVGSGNCSGGSGGGNCNPGLQDFHQ